MMYDYTKENTVDAFSADFLVDFTMGSGSIN